MPGRPTTTGRNYAHAYRRPPPAYTSQTQRFSTAATPPAITEPAKKVPLPVEIILDIVTLSLSDTIGEPYQKGYDPFNRQQCLAAHASQGPKTTYPKTAGRLRLLSKAVNSHIIKVMRCHLVDATKKYEALEKQWRDHWTTPGCNCWDNAAHGRLPVYNWCDCCGGLCEDRDRAKVVPMDIEQALYRMT